MVKLNFFLIFEVAKLKFFSWLVNWQIKSFVFSYLSQTYGYKLQSFYISKHKRQCAVWLDCRQSRREERNLVKNGIIAQKVFLLSLYCISLFAGTRRNMRQLWPPTFRVSNRPRHDERRVTSNLISNSRKLVRFDLIARKSKNVKIHLQSRKSKAFNQRVCFRRKVVVWV